MCVWATHCSLTRCEEEVIIECSVCLNATKEVVPESSVCLNVTKEDIPESSVYLNATKEVNTELLGCPKVATEAYRIFCALVSCVQTMAAEGIFLAPVSCAPPDTHLSAGPPVGPKPASTPDCLKSNRLPGHGS